MIITTAKDGNDPSRMVLIITLNQHDLDMITTEEHLEVDCDAMELPFCAATFFKAEDLEAVQIMNELACEAGSPIEIIDIRGTRK